MTFAKKIALVTGGNKGIGFEICRNLAGAGCTVLLGARNAERGQQTVRQLEQAGIEDIHFLEIDVTLQHTIKAAAEQIESRYGRLDILMNNAGVSLPGDGLPGAADPTVVQKIFDTNFVGALRVAPDDVAAAAQIARRAHRERLQRIGIAHPQQRSCIAHLQRQIQIHRV